jgi:hypothetical protein
VIHNFTSARREIMARDYPANVAWPEIERRLRDVEPGLPLPSAHAMRMWAARHGLRRTSRQQQRHLTEYVPASPRNIQLRCLRCQQQFKSRDKCRNRLCDVCRNITKIVDHHAHVGSELLR